MSEELNVTDAEGGWRTVTADDVSEMMLELASLRRERDEARKDAASCAAAHINAVAQLTEARRLLDDARAQSEAESIAFSAMRAEKERLQGIIDDALAQKPVATLVWSDGGDDVVFEEFASTFNGMKLYAAPVPAQPSAAPEAVAKDALGRIAAIAHNGGMACITEWEAITAIRRISLPWWNSEGTRNNLRDRADAAFLSAADTEVKNG